MASRPPAASPRGLADELPAESGGIHAWSLWPARQGRRLAEATDLLDQQQPDALANVVDILTVQLVANADGPHQRGVPLDEFIPRPLVAVAHASDQGNDRRVVAHGVSFPQLSDHRCLATPSLPCISRRRNPSMRRELPPP